MIGEAEHTIVESSGEAMHRLVARLFPICRSITGEGVRETLRILGDELPGLTVHSVPSGTAVFDWVVPPEWNIRDAYILDPSGDRIVDFAESNLHVVGYSVPVDRKMTLSELEGHLHSLPDKPDAIPYVTSYYEESWGFCISERRRATLSPEGEYTVVIDSTLEDGVLNFGELLIPGTRPEEVFLSTYICHPSMANNELSGPVVTTFLANWIRSRERRFTYRIVFVPETIGSLTYLSLKLDEMRRQVIAGYNVTCVGDDRAFSFLPSRHGDSLADRAARHVLGHLHPDYVPYTYLDRGSDERQYCAPGIDLPVASVMRSKYGTYPEYHTSLDDLDVVTAAGLQGAFDVLQRCIECIEGDERLGVTVLGEPHLQKHGLYPSRPDELGPSVRDVLNVIAYCDGRHSLLDVAETTGIPMWDVLSIAELLRERDLLAPVEHDDRA